ncbi:MAG: HAD family phosphatase [Pyrinomonadaceae bacterium]
MIQAILFDFNGVIINDEPLQLKAYQETLQPEGINLTEAEYYSALGNDDVTFVRNSFKRANIELSDEKLSEIIARKSAKHRKLINAGELPLFPGVVNFIKACKHAGYTIGIVSMARRAEIEYVCERAGLTDFFDTIISAEQVTACKPDPQCYRLAFRHANQAHQKAGRHALVPSDCVVFEDAPPGVVAARAAGMNVVGITHTVAALELREAGAQVVTPNLSDWTTDAVELVFN